MYSIFTILANQKTTMNKFQLLLYRRGMFARDLYELVHREIKDPKEATSMEHAIKRLYTYGSERFTIKTLKKIYDFLQLDDWNKIID